MSVNPDELTVTEIREWLSQDPDSDDVADALEAERSGEDRVTAIDALEDYLGDTTEEVEFRINRAFGDYEVGEVVELDPSDPDVLSKRRDGRLERW